MTYKTGNNINENQSRTFGMKENDSMLKIKIKVKKSRHNVIIYIHNGKFRFDFMSLSDYDKV